MSAVVEVLVFVAAAIAALGLAVAVGFVVWFGPGWVASASPMRLVRAKAKDDHDRR